MNFNLEQNVVLKLFDFVGDQSTIEALGPEESRALFEGYHNTMFIVDPTTLDVAYEMKMSENLALFRSIIESAWFKDTTFILWFTETKDAKLEEYVTFLFAKCFSDHRQPNSHATLYMNTTRMHQKRDLKLLLRVVEES